MESNENDIHGDNEDQKCFQANRDILAKCLKCKVIYFLEDFVEKLYSNLICSVKGVSHRRSD